MLQRVQTIYWSLSLLCLSILFFGVNLVSFSKGNNVFDLTLYQLKEYDSKGSLVKEVARFDYLIVAIVVLLICLTIFSFKNLKKQLNLAKWVMFIHLLIGFNFILFSYSGMIVSNPISVRLNFSIAFIFISLILSILGYQGVKKDKNLLDSVDRIR
jgi:hypothetical protein